MESGKFYFDWTFSDSLFLISFMLLYVLLLRVLNTVLSRTLLQEIFVTGYICPIEHYRNYIFFLFVYGNENDSYVGDPTHHLTHTNDLEERRIFIIMVNIHTCKYTHYTNIHLRPHLHLTKIRTQIWSPGVSPDLVKTLDLGIKNKGV